MINIVNDIDKGNSAIFMILGLPGKAKRIVGLRCKVSLQMGPNAKSPMKKIGTACMHGLSRNTIPKTALITYIKPLALFKQPHILLLKAL